jgi:hypothetical protein
VVSFEAAVKSSRVGTFIRREKIRSLAFLSQRLPKRQKPDACGTVDRGEFQLGIEQRAKT